MRYRACSCHFQELCKELDVKSALKASVVCSGTEILQLSKTEHTDAHSLSSTSTEDGATCIDVSSARDDPSAEDKEEDSSKDKALTPESMHSDIPNEEDAKVQDESPVERSPFEAGSSSDVPLGENASMKMSEDATISSSTDVVHAMKLSSALLSLKDHLTEVEQSWMELHTDIPAVQQMLHQVKEIRGISPLLFDVLMHDDCSLSALSLSSVLWRACVLRPCFPRCVNGSAKLKVSCRTHREMFSPQPQQHSSRAT